MMQSVWFAGDLCVYKHPGGEDYGVGRIKELDNTNLTCDLETFDSSGSIFIPVNELYSLTEESLKLVRSESNRIPALETIDNDFFDQKFRKILSLTEKTEGSLFVERTPQNPPLLPALSLNSTSQSHIWGVGDLCICQWSEDELYYYACIISLDSASCVVSFCFYGNEEEKMFDELHELGSDFELLVADEDNRGSFQQIRGLLTCNNVNNIAVKSNIKQHNGDCSTAVATDVYRSPKRTVVKSMPSSRGISRSISPRSASRSPPSGLPPKVMLNNIPKKTNSGENANQRRKPKHTSVTSQECGNTTCEPGKIRISLNQPNVSTSPIPTLLPPTCPDQLFGDLKQTPWQAMLISWFMCGYHTGFYEALQQERNKK